MRIIISAIGKLPKNSSEYNIFQQYITRIPWQINIKELEIKQRNVAGKESNLLLTSIDKGYKKIVLDEGGKMLSSQDFAKFLAEAEFQGDKLAFIIGGAYGHSKELLSKAECTISLSKMTLPHLLARIMLIEQIYRAYTININHPYHK